ncbi:helix-turn-helix domain-containing protein [Cerasicoccus arenae]|uniref:helix-turn-helix domain-containing protein n=1 Tax=Cerasicoccus arenae TaxID=424488 RepID=UPI00227D81B3|nr:helix-turn-helix domain-containing protein [Cerasicoccus arenae]
MASVQSLQRAFKILYHVAGRRDGCSVAEIAVGVGLKEITAYKLIRTLEAEKFLQRLGPPLRFTLGHSVHELKYLDDERVLLTEAGKAMLAAQRELPDASFVLLQVEGGDTYQRMRVDPEHYGRLQRMRDYQVHSYEKASSLLFLAYSSPEENEHFFAKHSFGEEGQAFWKSRFELDHFLAGVRRRGWSQPDFKNDIYYRLAVPIWSPSGKVISCIGCFAEHTGLTKVKKRQMIRQCCRTAQAITDTMRSLWTDLSFRKQV